MLMFFKKMKKNRKGYTLTELIVVVAILGVLAAVGAPMILNQVSTARTNTDNANAKSISNAYKIAMTAGDPTPPTPTNRADARAIIDNNLNPIPTPQQSSFHFDLNTATGEVTVTSSAITATSTYFTVSP